MTLSFRLSWIISPFGLMLPIFSLLLYIKSHRLKLEDFKFKLLNKINENIHSINGDDSKLINQQLDLHLM